jgi:hypothetical protein
MKQIPIVNETNPNSGFRDLKQIPIVNETNPNSEKRLNKE